MPKGGQRIVAKSLKTQQHSLAKPTSGAGVCETFGQKRSSCGQIKENLNKNNIEKTRYPVDPGEKGVPAGNSGSLGSTLFSGPPILAEKVQGIPFFGHCLFSYNYVDAVLSNSLTFRLYEGLYVTCSSLSFLNLRKMIFHIYLNNVIFSSDIGLTKGQSGNRSMIILFWRPH